ncbi:hypothetical protein SD70_23670 [Gordoniibacillus kamchatkensis]|uniref:CARDB domain-containing protein n=2 Tax=Gordoniibacillus kamchatkensis TaxID=1590651 RepID=A0ABR5ADU2_9BACL|nr:hypothetical protein SD70_23670 [Paenibacillus sp. VKM B-2647]
MSADLSWQGTTYLYVITVDITYAPITGPDLGAITLDQPACVETGKSADFTYHFTNLGLATTIPFKVSVRADGVEFFKVDMNGAAAGTSYQGTFSYTFGTTKVITVALDPDRKLTEPNTSNNTENFTISPVASCGSGPGPVKVTGTLSVKYPSVKFGSEQEIIQMRNVSISGGGCSLQSGTMVFTQGNIKWTHKLDQSGNFDDTFTATTGNGIGPGDVDVQYDIVTTCGWSTTIGPGHFQVTTAPGLLPPEFEIGWFDEDYYSGYNKPITMVPIGEKISFGLIRRPKTPTDNGTPYDPNGASVMYTTDIKTSPDPWIQRLYSVRGYGIHDDHFDNVLADVKGSHTIHMTAIDDLGAAAPSQSATINIVDPNPIPVITLPTGRIVEGRPLPGPIKCDQSYSPYKARSIVACDWHGTKQDMYTPYGDYTIKLDVQDSAGLWSLSPDIKTLHVAEDLPPTIAASLPSKGLRGVTMNMNDATFSPDGDILVQHTDKIICDTNINGNYNDDPVITVTPDSSGNFTFTPTVLANCLLRIYAKEDWGKSATKDFPFTIVNQAPTVALSLKGEQPSPPNLTGTNYDLATMLADKNRFQIEDYYNSSRYADLYYDSNEGALASPDRTNMLFLAPANMGASLTNANQAYNCDRYSSGCYRPLGIKATDTLYYYAESFYSCSGGYYCTPNGINLSVLNSQSNTLYAIKKTDGREYIEAHVNGLANMVWLRISPVNGGSYPQARDEFYRLSDIAAGILYPYKTVPFTPYRYYYPMQYATWVVPDYPPPADWVPVNNLQKPANNVPYTWDDGTTKTVNADALPPFQDREGNFYAFKCSKTWVYQGWEEDDNGRSHDIYGWQYDCKLEKVSPSGTVLWVGSDIYTNKYLNCYYSSCSYAWTTYPKIGLGYVTGDNKRLYTFSSGYNSPAKVIDNDTGAVLGNGYDLDIKNIYNDIAIITYQTTYTGTCGNVDPYDCDKLLTHYRFLNLKDGSIIFDSINLPGNTFNYDPFPGGGTISSDGKYVGYRTSITNELYTCPWGGTCSRPIMNHTFYVYDLMTGSHLYDTVISGGQDYDSYRNVIAGDGQGYFNTSTRCGDSCSTLKGQGWKTDIPSSMQAGNFSYGNIIDKTKDFYDGAIYLSMKYTNSTFSEYSGAGIIFREQDNKNYYQAALTAKGVILYKVTGGMKTVLDKQTNPLTAGQYADLKVIAKKDHIIVCVNGVPLIDVRDATFTHGRQGIFAEAPNVYLKKYRIEQYPVSTTTVDGISIVNTPIQSNVLFTDPDNDPPIPPLAKWTYTNTAPEKFLNAGDGFSDTNAGNSYVNYTVSSPLPKLNKVGVFKVDFTEPDDPAPPGHRYPDPMYASFRQYADPDTKYIIVHRAPINAFTVSQKADYTVSWNEQGYDPDRWLSPTTYSTEKPDYQTNRGIYQRLYSYTDPDGNVVTGKLVRPQKQGTYTVREAVADEYGAWSDWYEQQIYVALLPPNRPPSATLTFPAGTQSSPDYVSSLTPTVTWNQSDPDAGTVFSQARIVVKDEWGNVVIDRTINQNTASAFGQWQLDTALTIGAKYQVQVAVSDDGGAWSPWSNVGWMITNQPPSANMTYPSGTSPDGPTIVPVLRPTFVWNQTDPDPGTTFTYFELQVWDENNATLLLTSGQRWQGTIAASGSWAAAADLPVRQKLRVRVRVFDGRAWSAWSPDAWFLINRAPVADFDWSPKPAWEGDTLTLIDRSQDLDGDALSSAWVIKRPDGGIINSSLKNVVLPAVSPGKYDVKLTVSDGLASASVTKAIVVAPLTIGAEVAHTPDWLAYHERQDHETTSDPKDFYSGEKFIVRAVSSPTDVKSVTAWIDTAGKDGGRLQIEAALSVNGSPYSFSGELFDPKLLSLTEGLPEGLQTIHFRIRYANGVDKTQDIPVRIIGSVLETVGVHRRQ